MKKSSDTETGVWMEERELGYRNQSWGKEIIVGIEKQECVWNNWSLDTKTRMDGKTKVGI